jgi:spermidine synthase
MQAIAPPSQRRAILWLGTATLAGAIIMSLELAAFRLYAPYFGYSIYVWGSMISVVMVALAVGYALGGWLADRSHSETVLYVIILASGLYQLVIVFTVRSILVWLWQSGDFVATVTATLIIFVPPVTGLAATSPFVIRLLARAGHVGSTAGSVYALSTVGSIAGILATSFYLVPRFGTRMTLEILCALSALVGALGLVARKRIALLCLLPFGALFFVPKPAFAPHVVWTTESAYNWIAVLRQGNLRWLTLNDPRYFETMQKEGTVWSGYYHDDFALGPLLVPTRRLLVLGMGGGASIASTSAVAPDVEIDAVEIDPKVVEAAARFFGLRTDRRNLRIHVADARPWLARQKQSYELVHVDVYQGGSCVPFYLITVEFFHLIRSRMSDDSLLIMNVYDISKSRELLLAAGATLKQVFPSVAVLSRPEGNHILFAFAQERSAASIRAQLEQVEGTGPLQDLARHAAATITDFVPPPGTSVFTDDRAPVEEMTRRMLLAFRE